MVAAHRAQDAKFASAREYGRTGVLQGSTAQKLMQTYASKKASTLALGALGKIYPDVDIASHIIGQPITVSWESDPNFMGAFKANLPGHYRYQQRLFTHFAQDELPEHQRGIFLAGDDISWTAGWAEGAVQTGLNAVWGVVRHLGGSSSPENPGPGELLGEYGPIALD